MLQCVGRHSRDVDTVNRSAAGLPFRFAEGEKFVKIRAIRGSKKHCHRFEMSPSSCVEDNTSKLIAEGEKFKIFAAQKPGN
jgi:hypothetical protein